MGRQAKSFVIAALAAALYMALVLYLGNVLKLTGSNLLIFRIVMGLIGILALGIVAWFVKKAQGGGKKKQAAAGGATAGGSEELDTLFKGANARWPRRLRHKAASLRSNRCQ
ncbi:MAG: hypothetical protein IPM24_16370 [Bryobacterales bacterium]|nr:hypothetical protein [Bryobacterales bacterium]